MKNDCTVWSFDGQHAASVLEYKFRLFVFRSVILLLYVQSDRPRIFSPRHRNRPTKLVALFSDMLYTNILFFLITVLS